MIEYLLCSTSYCNLVKGDFTVGKGIYTYYKERLIEIGGKNKCLYLKNVVRGGAYDLGHIFESRDDKLSDFIKFLWSEKSYPFSVISNSEKNAILQNLELRTRTSAARKDSLSIPSEELEKQRRKEERELREAKTRAIQNEIAKLKELKRTTEEIEKDTGRYELYVGYPFVFGAISHGFNKQLVKAPLLLFPVKIETPDENTVELTLNEAEKIRINQALVFAYANAKKIDVSQLELEFDKLTQLENVADVIKYLEAAHIKIEANDSKNIFSYAKQKEPTERAELSVRNAAVLARFPISNSIYSDYTALERKKLTNDAINELLRTKKIKNKKKASRKKKTESYSYIVKKPDYAQSEVIRRVDEMGNMVIYGPPGTGKSQTIVNIITDAICKKKRVLVVSQKKAALDVVYNRLGSLNDRVMYLTDEAKEKHGFYSKCLLAHQNKMSSVDIGLDELEEKYREINEKIKAETQTLDSIYKVLNEKRPFGLSLSEMYSSSYMISKNTTEYDIYTRLCDRKDIMSLNYKGLRDALFVIKSKSLEKMYYNFMQDKEKNPLIDHMQPTLDIHTLSEVKGELVEIQKTKKGFFNTAKYPYYRQVMAYYEELSSEENLDAVVSMQTKISPQKKRATRKDFELTKLKFLDTLDAVEQYTKEYDCLHRVLTNDGYIAVIDNLLRGNTAYIKLVYDALDNYISQRDVNMLLESLDQNKIMLLNFAYRESKSYQNYLDIIDKILELRIYYEIIKYEDICQDELAKTVDYANITARISKLQDEGLILAQKITAKKNDLDYVTLYNEAKDNKDYLFQISKKQKLHPIRRTMDSYSRFILALFPCWLLSPENVSNLLPLEKNMFDVVIFDEASQVFIESTIPTIFRGKNIVVAGDAKQLRPSTTFMKRYLGADPELQDDPAIQAALEVDSLLDLAVARYDSANLTYHYRSRYSELIDFSNYAFYDQHLQIAPNISKNIKSRPIERHKVAGKWLDRRNTAEAKKIVEILKDISQTRKNNESIGIITFNSEQQSCIADEIDREMSKSQEFRSFMIKETRREENGEDTSLFIKNLENVQGDERDIIIFSIGYAENTDGKLYTNFGSLSQDGGENRLNVAITRARAKIIVVTSIEPEALKVEGAKNSGPKLLKKYLMYVRAVSSGDSEEVSAILSDLDTADMPVAEPITKLRSVEERMKEKLEKMGYTVETSLGNANGRISLAVYDRELDRYLVGVELDKDAIDASASTMERDVYKPKFLEGRGWTLMRVWCRDWWLYPQRVIKSIAQAAEKNKALLKKK